MLNKNDLRNSIIRVLNNFKASDEENINTLENLIKINGNFPLCIVNDEDFDIVIYAFDSRASEALVKTVIKHSGYATYNYTFYITEVYCNNVVKYQEFLDHVYYLVPLFSAIQKEYFEVADLLLKKMKADINYEPEDEYGENIVIYLYNNYHISNKQMKFILTRGFRIRGLPIELINCMMQDEGNAKFLKYMFKHFIFDNMFVLKMLTLRKANICMSDKQLDHLIQNEKSKIKINNETYITALRAENYTIIPTLIEYDSDPNEMVIDRIHQLHICEAYAQTHNLCSDFTKFIAKYTNLLLLSFLPSALDELFRKASREHIYEFSLSLRLNKLFKSTNFDFTSKKCERLLCAASRSNLMNFMEMVLLSMLSESKDPMIGEKLSIKNSKEQQERLRYQINNCSNDSLREYYQNLLDEAMAATNPLSVALFKDGDPTLFSLLVNLAIKTSHYDIVRFLVEHPDSKGKLDLNIRDNNGEQPLMLILSKSKNSEDALNLLQYMIEHGASSSIYDPETSQPISIVTLALNEDRYLALKYLLKNSKITLKNILHRENPATTLDPLSFAIIDGDLARVKQLVFKDSRMDKDLSFEDQAMKMNQDTVKRDCNRYRFTPMTLAYLLNEKEIFDFLIEKEWPVNELDDYAYSVLHFMILKDDRDSVKELIQHTKANVNLQKNSLNRFHSALEIAIDNSGKEMLQELFKSPTFKVNGVNDQQEIILFSIFKSNRLNLDDKIEIIQFLLDQGSEVNVMDQNGKQALAYAIELQSIPLMKYFIAYGADVNMVDDKKNVPLHYAIEMKSEAMVSFLIEYGADVTFVDIFDTTLLSYAIQQQCLPVIHLLIEHGADVNAAVKDYNNKKHPEMCMLFLAIDTSNKEIVKMVYLLETHKLDPKDLTMNCLKDLIWRERSDHLKILVQHGFDINLKDEEGRNLLVKAINFRKFRLSNKLLKFNPDLEPLNQHIDVFRYYLSCNEDERYQLSSLFRDLIQHGLNVNAQDHDGETLLIYAIKQQDIPTILLLLSSGSDPFYRNLSRTTIFAPINTREEPWSLDHYNEFYNINHLEDYRKIQSILEQYRTRN
ncbi:ankyrin repeat-containing domain protein [Neocallimastix lanati (nom. inval.)]|nr:ankyrin repeat-containing domain protein [Neocallimastix sp. JGI-2020a]